MNPIKLTPTLQQIEAAERNKRLTEAVKNPKLAPTIKDVYALMVDIAAHMQDDK